MFHRTNCLTLAALIAVGLLCPVAAQAATRSVSIGNDFFSPKTVTIDAGDKVKWAWRSGGHPHDVTARAFPDSGVRSYGSFVVSFRRAGRYAYVCSFHRGMIGTVLVRN